MSSSEPSPLASIWVNVSRMLQRRGFRVPRPSGGTPLDDVTSVADITGKHRSQFLDLTIYAVHPTKKTSILTLFWTGPFGVKNLLPFVDEYLRHVAQEDSSTTTTTTTTLSQIIIVQLSEHTVHPQVSHDVRDTVQEMYPTLSVRIFPGSFFRMDKAAHDLSPAYTVVDDTFDEARMRCKKHNLPKLPRTDPQALYYDLRPGQTVRIDYPDLDIGTYVQLHVCNVSPVCR